MSTSIQIPYDFRYVGVPLIGSVGLLLCQGFTAGLFRHRAGIQYPQMYAEQAQVEKSRDALIYNCAQRVHQNTLENIPIIWAVTIFVGIQKPILATSLCSLWVLGRISYTFGYITGDPIKRVTVLYGAGTLGMLGLTLTAATYAINMAWEGVSTKLLSHLH